MNAIGWFRYYHQQDLEQENSCWKIKFGEKIEQKYVSLNIFMHRDQKNNNYDKIDKS